MEFRKTIKYVRIVLAVVLLLNALLFVIDRPVSVVGIILQILIELNVGFAFLLLHKELK